MRSLLPLMAAALLLSSADADCPRELLPPAGPLPPRPQPPRPQPPRSNQPGMPGVWLACPVCGYAEPDIGGSKRYCNGRNRTVPTSDGPVKLADTPHGRTRMLRFRQVARRTGDPPKHDTPHPCYPRYYAPHSVVRKLTDKERRTLGCGKSAKYRKRLKRADGVCPDCGALHAHPAWPGEWMPNGKPTSVVPVALEAVPCPETFDRVCEHCGERYECAPGCSGIAAVLDREDIHVIDGTVG